MRLLKQIARRLRAVVHRDDLERDVDDEMRFHLDQEIGARIAAGDLPAEARRRALIAFGGVELHKEHARDALGLRWLHDFLQDVGYALRQMRLRPGFALVTLLTLGLGTGATTVIYTLTESLKTLPFDHAEQLVDIRQYDPVECSSCGGIAAGNYLAVRSAPALEGVALWREYSPVLRGTDHARVVHGVSVSLDYFPTLRVTPMLGVGFAAADTLVGAPGVALLSESFWRQQFAADPRVIGRNIWLDGTAHTVRGIVRASLTFPMRADVFTGLKLDSSQATDHATNGFHAVARLRDGVSERQAESQVATIGRHLSYEFAGMLPRGKWTLGLSPLWTFGRGDQLDTQTAIFNAAVLFVLLVACLNLGALLIARLTRRRRELAVRAATGASGPRLSRQLLTETVLLALMAGIVGSAVAWWGVSEIVRAVPADAAPPGWSNVHTSWRAFLVSMLTACFAGVVVGLWPSLRFSRPSLDSELRDGAPLSGAKGATGSDRLRRTLVIVELSFSLVLLAAAGLFVRSVSKLAQAPTGMQTDHVLTLRLQLPATLNGKPVDARGYFDRLAARVKSQLGLSTVGLVAYLPLDNLGFSATAFTVPGRPEIKATGGTRTQVATMDFYRAFRIPVLRGRLFTDADNDTARHVAIVNRALAAKFFPNENPIGNLLELHDGTRLTIVGEVGDVRQCGTYCWGKEIVRPAAAVPRRTMYLIVRSATDPSVLAPTVVRTIERLDPNVALDHVEAMDDVIADWLAPYRVERMLMVCFAVVSLLIATIGLYATISYAVSTRTREFGVRVAMGASSLSVVKLVLGQALRLTLVALAIGLVLAFALTRVMQSQLYGVTPSDPATFAAVGVAICVVALGAGVVPAMRAMRLDPVQALKAE